MQQHSMQKEYYISSAAIILFFMGFIIVLLAISLCSLYGGVLGLTVLILSFLLYLFPKILMPRKILRDQKLARKAKNGEIMIIQTNKDELKSVRIQ